MKRLIFDLDGVIALDDPDRPYAEREPNRPLIERMRAYKAEGFEIAVATARNMRTFSGQIGKINAVTLPGVIESAVIGAPHPDFGEAVVAVIAGAGEESAVIAAARERLAAFKAPKRVFFVDDLPRNAMGKVQKAALRDAYAEVFGETA